MWYPGFIQQVIQDVSSSSALFTAVPRSSRLLVRSFYRWTVAVASYIRNWFFVSRGCGYIWANHSKGLPCNKFVITIVECDTWETSLVHCLRYCYSCFTLVTILGNELVIFPGIAFYYGNNYNIPCVLCICSIIYLHDDCEPTPNWLPVSWIESSRSLLCNSAKNKLVGVVLLWAVHMCSKC